MQYVEKNGVGYYHSPLLQSKHGFSTRIGGTSTHPALSGLNLAFGRGDGEDTVLENLRLFADAIGVDARRVISLPQVHGTDVVAVTEVDTGRGYTRPADGTGDGYMTDVAGLPLGVKSADCVPVLLEARDAGGRVLAVSAVHAGWRGTAGGIVSNAVKALRERCGDADFYAAIGPCIGSCCFEVDLDCVEAFAHSFGAELVQKCFKEGQNGKYYGDLTLVNRLLLHAAGLPDSHIDTADICTCCHPDVFFSHRYAVKYTDGQRGTMLSVICK